MVASDSERAQGRASITSILVPVDDLSAAIEFLRVEGGFELHWIHPADAPRAARLSRDSTTIDLEIGTPRSQTIRVEEKQSPARFLDGPSGLRIEFVPEPRLTVPVVVEESALYPGDAEGRWHTGRAGMEYRDLVPTRFGGAIIASNIRIQQGGPVPDYVHFHDVLFQLIYCRRGWVEVVYEDQGEPFVLHAGDCVIQPPEIRHRVLRNSDGMEVIEIGYPAEHLTRVEPVMTLPNVPTPAPRTWSGQSFVRYDQNSRVWNECSVGVLTSDTGIFAATRGLAHVELVRLDASAKHHFGSVGDGHQRVIVAVDGHGRVTTSGTEQTFAEGGTITLRPSDEATITSDTGLTVLNVVIDTSKVPSYWRPMV